MRIRRTLLLAALPTTAVLVLSLRPAPRVHAEDREATRFAEQEPTAAPTIQVYSRETYVDVNVVDKEGRPVHGLTRDDFTILEDGKPVSPNSFAEHSSGEDAGSLTPVAKPALPANTFTNFDPGDGKGPINLLLFDTGNLPAMTQQILHKQMIDFVERMPPGTRMAVLRMTYRLSVLQGITTDKDLVRAAINSDKTIPGAFALEDPFVDVSEPDPPPVPYTHAPPVAEAAEWQGNPPPEAILSAVSMRAEYGNTAMKQLARFLEGMPGRKNLIWLTGFSPRGAFDGALTSEVDLLSRAHVTIYPIDPRGLEAVPRNPIAAGLRSGEINAMKDVAAQTGGRFYGHDDMAGSVLKILDNSSNFYALTYVPTQKATTSGQFRNITVKVNRPGLTLTYRPGYYATDPTRSLTNMKLPRQPTAMETAMERGAILPTQILFRAHVDPLPTVDAKLTEGNQPDPKRMKPLYRHLAVSYTIALDGISFDRAADGKYHSDFELGVMVYNADGQLVNTVSKHVRPVVAEQAYQSMLKNGAQAHEEITVPAKGEYFLRIGVHDLTTDHMGAVEVPTATLAPGSAPTVASGAAIAAPQ